MKRILNLVVACAALAFGTAAMAGFTSGNIVIYRVGGISNQGSTTGSNILTNNGNIVWLDECLPPQPGDSALTIVQSIMMPTNYFGANSPFLEDGASTADGLMTRSVDGRFLILTGYGATLGQDTNEALPSEDATVVPRVVGLVDGNGNIDTTTTQTNSLSND
jgi:hypothetical protein